MSTSTPYLSDVPTDRETARAELSVRIAPRALAPALLAGIAADLLLRGGPVGVGFPVWIALAVLTLTSLSWRARREVPTEAATWLFVAMLSACGLAWRDSGMLQFLDLVATAGALGMAAIALGNRQAGLLAERFRETIWAGLMSLRVIAKGLIPNLADAIGEARSQTAWESQSRRALRSGLLGIGVLVVFGSLLRGADPIFASLVQLPDFDLGVSFSHVVVAGWFTWLVCGWANAALGSTVGTTRAPHRLPLSLSVQDLSASLGVLNVLFATFMVAQLGWLFGGESFLRERTGLTAAEYARHGFFEMVWVVVLVVPLLVFTRAALTPGREVARRHTLLSLPLLALLAGIIVSAAGRMRLYVHFYGLTVDRFYPLVLMAWLIAVLMWLVVTVLQDRGRPFIAGVAVSAFAVLIALNVAAPDAIVARFNASRSLGGLESPGADLPHMSELSGEAVDVAIRETLASPRFALGSALRKRDDLARCVAADNLMRRWGPSSDAAVRRDDDGAWRQWNAGERNAVRLVGVNAGALRRVQQTACAGIPVAGRFRRGGYSED